MRFWREIGLFTRGLGLEELLRAGVPEKEDYTVVR